LEKDGRSGQPPRRTRASARWTTWAASRWRASTSATRWIYETRELRGHLESADFAEEGESAEELIKGIVEFYREYAANLNPSTKAARK
jgi:hypothetical protein